MNSVKAEYHRRSRDQEWLKDRGDPKVMSNKKRKRKKRGKERKKKKGEEER